MESKPLRDEDPRVAFTIVESRLENIEGTLSDISRSVKEMTNLVRDTVKEVRKDVEANRAAVDGLTSKFERNCDAHTKILAAAEDHMRTDKPMEHYLGKWAMGLVMFAATIAGSFVVNRILRIVSE